MIIVMVLIVMIIIVMIGFICFVSLQHPRSAWLRSVYLVWSVPTETEWSWFRETLQRASSLAELSSNNRKNAAQAAVNEASYPRLTIFGHITQVRSN